MKLKVTRFLFLSIGGALIVFGSRSVPISKCLMISVGSLMTAMFTFLRGRR